MTVNARATPARRRDLLGRRRAHRAEREAQRAAAPDRHRLGEDTIELIRRLAEHHPDRADRRDPQPPRPPDRDRPAVHRDHESKAPDHAPASPPRHHRTPKRTWSRSSRPPPSSACRLFTIRRWLREGLLPGEQTTPTAPWRIRLDRRGPRAVRARRPGRVRARSTRPRKLLGCRAPDRVAQGPTRRAARAIQVTNGRRKGLRIEVPDASLDRLISE